MQSYLAFDIVGITFFPAILFLIPFCDTFAISNIPDFRVP